MKYIIALMLLLMPVTAQAMDKKLGTINCFKIGIFDEFGNGIAGLDVITPFSDFAVKIQCGANSVVTVNETGDTVADEGGGYYYVCTNDTITNTPEEECLNWQEGEGVFGGLIAKTPVKFKAVGATMSELAGVECQVTGSPTTTAIPVISCIDEAGGAITLNQTDMFVGSYAKFINRGATQCNVVGQGVFINDFNDTTDIITVKSSDMPGSEAGAAPNTSNCNIRIKP